MAFFLLRTGISGLGIVESILLLKKPEVDSDKPSPLQFYNDHLMVSEVLPWNLIETYFVIK